MQNLNVGSTNTLTVSANIPNDSQITLAGGKVKIQLTASSPVTVGFWGPYTPNTVVDPTTRPKPGLLKVCGSSVTIGNNAISAQGQYLVEVTSPTTTTVELTVTPWSPTFFQGILNNILQYVWKFTSPNKC